jgi:thiamine biosynthesis lipoprotein ApbE
MGKVWQVATQQAASGGEERLVIEVCDSAFSVSDAGSQTEAHIVDPRGHGGTVRAGSVLVTGPSARLADAWSTALVVNPHAVTSLPHGYRADWLDGSRGAAL